MKDVNNRQLFMTRFFWEKIDKLLVKMHKTHH